VFAPEIKRLRLTENLGIARSIQLSYGANALDENTMSQGNLK
jgi:hypothetical protein